MPKVPSISPATGNPTSSSFIHTLDCNFIDNAGRTLLLRGVNLSGSSKAPVGQESYILEDFWKDAENGGKSFIGRPLNVDDGSADVHLARLRGWGFNMLRFPVTWEALEHEGPGKYDYEFMDYTIRVLRKCKDYGFKVYIDPHQDVWSRFSGGSGAPFWTFAACGIDPRNLTATQSAIIHAEYPSTDSPDPASLPAMIWSTNYSRLFSQTVFTMFFAGRDFLPKCIIDGVNIQDYLQSHFIEAFGQLADRIRDSAGDLLDECIIGWDSMNEPFEGFCGWEDLNANPTKQGSTLKKGSSPTPAQSFRLAMGTPQTVEVWSFGTFGPSKSGTVVIDPKGARIWADSSIEDANGLHPKWGWTRDPGWKLGTQSIFDMFPSPPTKKRFLRHPSKVEFVQHYWLAHFRLFGTRIRASHPEAILFVQPPVFAPPPPIPESSSSNGFGLHGRAAFSGHYYDGLTLITRHWNWFNADALGVIRGHYSSPVFAVKVGEAAIRKSIQEQLGILKADTLTITGGEGIYPTIIGEIGTPFDMDAKRSYGYTDGGKYKGDYSRQERALDASLNAADGPNALNYTVWTYCPDSTHEWGDGWDMEDLSLWSADDVDTPLDADAEVDSSKLQLQQPVLGNEDYESSSRLQLQQQGGDEEVGMYGMGRDDSQAVLLQKKNQSKLSDKYRHGNSIGRRAAHPHSHAASSSLSLDTLGSFSSQNPSSSAPNPYTFLTSGARAPRAFSRPFPVKTIGTPYDIQFDIASTVFRLTVRVRAGEDPQGGQEEGLATEIFVPVVHYAHPRLLSSSSSSSAAVTATEGLEQGQSTVDSAADSGTSSPTLTNAVLPVPIPISTSTSSTIALPNSNLTWLGLQVGDTDADTDNTEPDDILDIEVSASTGRWEVHGQMLKWWYDVPVPDSSLEGGRWRGEGVYN
ncbi:glycoside hydrolase [Gymnopus androsaceus JB14]|uniref:Glycoside hydrolase n=1 Tax=Gymnopus androsaceus JB14 TaxID=1447944 RepID=A0A6A4H5H0_9AGAR|nr:glycoside hydrolase [Gymnopus androsaceus JB14]